MSTFKVSIEKINKVEKHFNADKLDVVTVLGWNCVTAKDSFKEEDLCIYFPIDSILPEEIEKTIFGPDSKIKLNNHRIRTIKLRGVISQGLVVPVSVFFKKTQAIGTDVTKQLGVTKYEPPVEFLAANTNGKSYKKQVNSNFKKYTGIENSKNYPNIFVENETVSVTEKLHGSSWRAGYVKNIPNTLFKKILNFFHLLPKYEFVFGSHNVQLQNKFRIKDYYSKSLGLSIYEEMVLKYDIKNRLKHGEVIYGEIIGDGVQKGFTYGCKPGERKLVLFDLMVEDKYLDPIAFRKWTQTNNFEIVPELYHGPFNKEKIIELTKGPSIYSKTQPIREGCVVKPIIESWSCIGRTVLKFINDEYLLKNQDNESIPH